LIEVRGAREHNLRGVDVDLGTDGITVFVGPSGSGKTSLLLDTLHAEGRRRYLEALSGGLVRARLRRPDVERVEGLPPTVSFEAVAPSAAPRATLADLAAVRPLLDVLLGRAGVQHCPQCDARIATSSQDEIVGALLALPAGTRLRIEIPLPSGDPSHAAAGGFSRVSVDGDVRAVEDVGRVPPGATVRIVVDRLRLGDGDRRERLHDAVRLAGRAGSGQIVAVTDLGERAFVDRPRCVACALDLPPLSPRLFRSGEAAACSACSGAFGDCAACGGTGLGAAASAVRWGGARLRDLLDRPAGAQSWADAPDDAVSRRVLGPLRQRLETLRRLGLGALRLGRPAPTLSTGEVQRARLVGLVATAPSGVLYALDEPAAGLAAIEAEAVAACVRALIAAGNGVVAVDHNPVLIAAADRVVEFGPGAGPEGGRIVFDGPPSALAAADTATGRWWASGRRLPAVTCPSGRDVVLAGVPLRAEGLTVWTGPSGSGKSRALAALAAAVEAGGTPWARVLWAEGTAARAARSIAATYVGAWSVVRELLAATAEARVRGLDAGAFSLAQPGGRCEACQGTGEKRVDLEWLPELWTPCPVCDGRRFAGDALAVRWHGLDPGELLQQTAAEARRLLGGVPRLERALRALVDCGLGHVPLGLPTRALSSGEASRLRLARELARGAVGPDALVLLDDPTRGQHAVDAERVLRLAVRLAEAGAAVVVASHDPEVARALGQGALGPPTGPQYTQ
jgi:excinuclease ABC subunit A